MFQASSRRDFLVRASASAGVLTGLGSRTARPAAALQTNLTPLSLQLNWNPNAEHAPYFLGRDLGFYAEEGIELEILPGQGSAAAAQLVGTGSSQFGVAVADALVIATAQRY